MKQRFKVEIVETYRKTIDVIAEDEGCVDDEVRAIEEAGEIDWNPSEDFDGWDIVNVKRDTLLDSEKEYVQKWAMNTVRTTELVDSDWVLEEMTRDECRDWFECIRDKGIDIPVLATSSDLWDAVQKERGCK